MADGTGDARGHTPRGAHTDEQNEETDQGADTGLLEAEEGLFQAVLCQ
jgi:hypothetical protein